MRSEQVLLFYSGRSDKLFSGNEQKTVKQEAPGQDLSGVTGEQIRYLITLELFSCFVVTFMELRLQAKWHDVTN